jgi:hypothetical protein
MHVVVEPKATVMAPAGMYMTGAGSGGRLAHDYFHSGAVDKKTRTVRFLPLPCTDTFVFFRCQ